MNNLVSIRLALPSEREELEALQLRSSLRNPGDRDALVANPDAIVLPIEQIAAEQVFIAEIGDKIVGFAAVLPRPDGDTELDGLFVEPANWRQGIGRSLVDRCGDYAIARNSTALYVVGNQHAKGFYEACGFEVLGMTGTRFGAGSLMRKRL